MKRPSPSNDTIVARATAPGRGAVDLVRLSGPRAVEITGHFIEPRPADRRPRYVYQARAGGVDGVLDRLLAVRFAGPRSYTGEDVVELSCHGGGAIARRLVEIAVGFGARPAEPGEFTRRAWEAGKLDLLQAEAVGALAGARSLIGVRLLERQLGGALSRLLDGLRRRSIELAAGLEARLAYPEEGLNEAGYRRELEEGLCGLDGELAELESSAAVARVAVDGAVVVLVGEENVGKSTLFNRLLGAEAALVTPTPGTTRDILRGELELDGLPLVLYDTAGRPELWRDELTELAARRASVAARTADALLVVLDARRPRIPDWAQAEIENQPALVLLNKRDLLEETPPDEVDGRPALALSAAAGAGVEELTAALRELLLPLNVDTAPTSRRQRLGLRRAREALVAARSALGHGIWDAAAEELVALRRALEEVLGLVTDEDVLDALFADFCVGK